MKYHFESTEREFFALMDTIQFLVKAGVKPAAAVAEAVKPEAEAEAPEAEDNDESAPEGATVTPLRVVPPPEPVAAPVDPEAAQREAEAQAKALHGKDTWIALIDLWRTNFMVEDAPQPDRVANLQGASSPFTMAFLRTRAGLTDATREAIYLLDGGDPDTAQPPRYGLTPRQLREARLIAENIAQVASFHAPWMTEQLEYAYEFRTLPPEE